jgi:hypothetical protein
VSNRPERLKDSDDLDPFARELLRAARPTRPMPPANSLRGAHRIARLAAAPAVALGVGLWSKAVGAAFAVGFTSALGLVALTPALKARLFDPPVVEVGTAPAKVLAPVVAPLAAPPVAPAAPPSPSAAPAALDPPHADTALDPADAHATAPRVRSRSAPASAPTAHFTAAPPQPSETAADGGSATSSLALLQADPTAAPGASPPPPLDPAMSAEAALLLEARKVMGSDPAHALVLLHRHAVRFPKPLLGMEREVLVIEALDRSGRRAEAVTRAKELLASSPSAFYRRRLERLIGQMP